MISGIMKLRLVLELKVNKPQPKNKYRTSKLLKKWTSWRTWMLTKAPNRACTPLSQPFRRSLVDKVWISVEVPKLKFHLKRKSRGLCPSYQNITSTCPIVSCNGLSLCLWTTPNLRNITQLSGQLWCSILMEPLSTRRRRLSVREQRIRLLPLLQRSKLS